MSCECLKLVVSSITLPFCLFLLALKEYRGGIFETTFATHDFFVVQKSFRGMTPEENVIAKTNAFTK